MSSFRTFAFAAAASLLAFGTVGSADAASFSWDLTTKSTGSTGSNGNTLSFTATGGGNSLTAEAYQVTSATTAGTTSASLVTAYLGAYSSGLGVTDRSENGSAPGHTVSNNATSSGNHVWDMVVFQLPTTLQLTSITLSQWCSNSGAGPSGCSGAVFGLDDITVYTGHLSSLGAPAGQSLTALGLTQVSSPNLNGGGDRTINLSGVAAGDYIIIAASLSDGGTNSTNTDFLKIAGLGAQTPTVPEPGTLATLGFGLAGLAALRRRMRRAG
jgi:hypothetical protein